MRGRYRSVMCLPISALPVRISYDKKKCAYDYIIVCVDRKVEANNYCSNDNLLGPSITDNTILYIKKNGYRVKKAF